MRAMTNLPETVTPIRPTELAVTVLDTHDDVLDYLIDGGIAPDKDGNVLLCVDDEHVLVPIKGLYRLQVVDDSGTVPGPGLLVTEGQFKANFTAYDEPSFEYGVQLLARPRDVVSHGGSLEHARDALKALPVLEATGDYGIVRRLVHEPGDWERVE